MSTVSRPRVSRTKLACIMLLVILTGIAAHAGQFVQAPQYTVGNNPEAVTVADFNGDGILDVAVANSASNNVSVLLGKGDGTFGTALNYPTDSTPLGIASGDFNGDGHIDIAVTNSGSNALSIFLGKGDGTFQSKVDYATGKKPWGIAVGTFSTSGFLDIVVTNATDDTVGVFLGNGSGMFSKQVTYNTGTNPSSVAVGDVNNDGFPDLVVANNNDFNTISVILGVGNGTFQGDYQYSVGGAPVSVALADFNGDGNLDVAVAVGGSQGGNAINLVSILLGEGNGGFQPHADYPTGVFPTGLAVGDFNHDGNIDVAVSAGNGNTVTVLWGTGSGVFQGQVNPGTGDTPYAVAAGDFNNDGVTDLLAVNFGENSISVILSNGSAKTFQDRVDYGAGVSPYSIATADFNGDGHLDLALGNYTGGTISIEFGNGDGTFQAPITYPASSPYSIAVGDFNGDKIQDLAVADYAAGTVSILLGMAGGTFQPATTLPVGSEPASVATADFIGNGNLDLAVANFHSNTVSILLGNGAGGFQSAVNYTVGNGPVSVEVADFNGDGIPDLAVVNETDNSVSILLGVGNGTFGKQSTYSTGTGGNPLSLVVGDFSGDGKLDLAVADYQTKEVSVLLGNGDGTFQTVQQYPTGANPSSIVAADFNGDGNLDLALTSTPLGTNPGNLVSLLLGNGDGTFGEPSLFGVGYLSYSAVVGDFNGDGAIDLAVANEASNTVSVLLNSQGTAISTLSSINPSSYGQSVTFTTEVAASVASGAAPTGTVTLKIGATVLGSGSLSSNGTFVLSTSSLPVGSNSLSVVYSGDSNYQPHTIKLTQTVQKTSSVTSLSSSLNPSNPNQQVTFTATVAPSGNGQPTGTVNFLDGTSVIGSVALSVNGAALFSTSSLSQGTHTITASYSGDANFAGSSSPVVSQAVQPGSNSVSVVSSLNPSGPGQSVTFTSTVFSGTSTMPTGSVKFEDGNTILGTSALNGSGIASLTTATLSLGTHNITAVYSGDSNFNPSTSPVLSQVVQKASTTTTLSSTPSSAYLNQQVTFTATVVPGVSGTPTGTVTFTDGTAQLGTAALNASAVANFSISTLTVGTHVITASYSGDGSFNGSISGAMNLAIPQPDFSLAAGALSPSTISPGGSATSAVTINPIDGMDITKVALTCSIAPVTTPAPNCSVGSVTLANNSGTATVSVTTVGQQATNFPEERPTQRNDSRSWLAFGVLLPAMLLGGVGLNKPGRRKLLSFALVLLVLSAAGFESACGGSGQSKTTTVTGNSGTRAGVYTVTISGSNGGTTHTATASFTVQ